jgi:hypothetical protein
MSENSDYLKIDRIDRRTCISHKLRENCLQFKYMVRNKKEGQMLMREIKE